MFGALAGEGEYALEFAPGRLRQFQVLGEVLQFGPRLAGESEVPQRHPAAGRLGKFLTEECTDPVLEVALSLSGL